MSKRDEKIKEIEAILKELKSTDEETSATLAYDYKKVSEKRYKTGRKFSTLLALWRWKSMILLLVFAVVVGGASIGIYSWLTGSSFTQKDSSFVEQIRDMNSLATAQGFVKAVIEQEDNKLFGKEIKTDLPGTKRKILVIIPGTVLAGVDLQKVKSTDIDVNDKDHTISISLPRAEILQAPSIDTEHIETFSIEGLFRSDVDWNEGYEIATEAKEKIQQEALDQGILSAAEKNAGQALKNFFTELGYDATITFHD